VLFVGAVTLFALTAPFDRKRRALHLYTCAWAYHYVSCLPLWSARFENREHVEPGRAYIIVANHQSLGDILVLFGLFKHYKWVMSASASFLSW
jgi:1-acyl-sn-glycerol-3-phosphate acyltransferase